jgi:hypothetical protein
MLDPDPYQMNTIRNTAKNFINAKRYGVKGRKGGVAHLLL